MEHFHEDGENYGNFDPGKLSFAVQPDESAEEPAKTAVTEQE